MLALAVSSCRPSTVCLQHSVDSSLHQWHQNKILSVCCSWQMKWLCSHTAGLPVLPLASSRASALSRPQDQDLAGPRYRRRAMCCSRPEPLWGNMQGTEQGAHFFAAVPKEHLFASLRVRCMFASTDRSSVHKCISGWQQVYPRLQATVKRATPGKRNPNPATVMLICRRLCERIEVVLISSSLM